MSDTTQNDWDVVAKALNSEPGSVAGSEGMPALERLREFTAFTIQSLNARITELEAELALRAPEEGWPKPANLE